MYTITWTGSDAGEPVKANSVILDRYLKEYNLKNGLMATRLAQAMCIDPKDPLHQHSELTENLFNLFLLGLLHYMFLFSCLLLTFYHAHLSLV